MLSRKDTEPRNIFDTFLEKFRAESDKAGIIDIKDSPLSSSTKPTQAEYLEYFGPFIEGLSTDRERTDGIRDIGRKAILALRREFGMTDIPISIDEAEE